MRGSRVRIRVGGLGVPCQRSSGPGRRSCGSEEERSSESMKENLVPCGRPWLFREGGLGVPIVGVELVSAPAANLEICQ